jgi:hypothetical protein
MRNIRFSLILVIAALILGGLPLLGQQNVGRITGTITDPSGAVVPGADVVATETATSLKAEMLTNASGAYTFPNLPNGNYALSVSRTGFESYQQSNIVLISGQTVTIDVKLVVGSATQIVQVTSAAPAMDVSTSNVAVGSTNSEIQALPITLYGNSSRSAISIAKTYNGVSYDPIESGGQEFMVLGRATINGITPGQWAYNIDGIPGSVGASEREHDMQAPTPDMVDEVRVTSNTDVSEPFSPGTTVDLTMKSGTNKLHGALYEYLRNQKFDSRETFLPTVPQDQQNNWGFAIGGPIYIPHVYDGRDKSFFFVSWDFYRFRSTFAGSGGEEATTATVATQAMRQGDFSGLLGAAIPGVTDPSGKPVYQGEIFDPATTRAGALGGFVRDPFAFGGNLNVVDPTRLSAISSQVIAQESLPNLPGVANNWIGPNAEVRVDKDQLALKFDELINPRNRVTFTWDKLTPFTTSIGQTKGVNTGFSGHSFLDGGFGYLPPTLGESAGFIDDRDQYRMRVNYVWTVKSNLLVSFRAAIIANPNRRVPWYPLTGKTATFGAAIGLKGLESPRAPVVNIAGFSTLGSGFSNGRWPDSTVPVDLDFAWSKGTHNIKFGANYDLEHSILVGGENGSWGTFNFGPNETGLPGVSTTGAGIASMMLGEVDNASAGSNGLSEYGIAGAWAFYGMDTWRVTPKLTITPGVRWDYFTPPYDHHNAVGTFDPTIPNPGANGILGAIAFYGNGTGRNGLKTMQTSYLGAWAGTLGIAYQLNAKTVVRANYANSYGAAWDRFLGIGGVGYPTYGISATLSPTTVDNGVHSAFNWADPFPLTFPSLPIIDPTLQNGSGITYLARNQNRPPMYQTPSFQIERELPADFILSVGYAGTFLHHGYTGLDNLDQLAPAVYAKYGALLSGTPQAAGIPLPYPSFTGSAAQALLAYPQYTSVAVDNATDGDSSYNALQIKVQKRVGHGLTFLTAFTDSKMLTNFGGAQSTFLKRSAKALYSEDEPKILAVSWTYDLPVGKGKHFLNSGGPVDRILGQWKLSAIQNYWSGRPVNVGTEAGIPFAGEWPVLVPGVSPRGTSCSNYNWGDPNSRILNPAAFATPAAFTFGNVHTLPNVRNCGYAEEDFGLNKDFKLTESKTLRIGTFWQNAFNRVDFQAVEFNADMNSASFGRYGDAYPGRKIQLYMRFEY